MRFVVGHSDDAALERGMAAEEAAHRDFMRLPFQAIGPPHTMGLQGLVVSRTGLLRPAANYSADGFSTAQRTVYRCSKAWRLRGTWACRGNARRQQLPTAKGVFCMALRMSVHAQESYAALNKKTLAFFGAAAREYDADYIVKVDDDAFMRLDRLSHAVEQWRQLGAGTRVMMLQGNALASAGLSYHRGVWGRCWASKMAVSLPSCLSDRHMPVLKAAGRLLDESI